MGNDRFGHRKDRVSGTNLGMSHSNTKAECGNVLQRRLRALECIIFERKEGVVASDGTVLNQGGHDGHAGDSGDHG